MAKKAFVLSESDRDTLKEIIAEFRGMPASTTGRAAISKRHIQAPEVYVALSPEGGIPGAEFGIGDIPGSADCDVYKLVDGELEYAGFDRHVFNLSADEIAEQQWILINRDKWGQWYVAGSFVTETTGTDTGTGTDILIPVTPPPTSMCNLVRVVETDCLLAYASNGQRLTLVNYGDGYWTSNNPNITGTEDEVLFYENGQGSIEFGYSDGQLYVKVNGIKLVNCGNNCWAGGPITGHGYQRLGTDSGTDPDTQILACLGTTLTVCIACIPCLHCQDIPTNLIATITSGEGTGTDIGTGTTLGACDCLEGTYDLDKDTPESTTWQATGIGICDQEATLTLDCNDNIDGKTVDLTLNISCGASNHGTATITVNFDELEFLDETFLVPMLDQSQTYCGTCKFQWNEMAGTWSQITDNCTGLCGCPPPPSFPGTYDGHQILLPCSPVGSEIPCCIGYIRVRIIA